MKINSLRKQKGFTLIELLVVIAIIGLLAGVVIISLRAPQGKTRDAKRISELVQLKQQVEIYNSNCGNYPGLNGAYTYSAISGVDGQIGIILSTQSASMYRLSADCTGTTSGFTTNTPTTTMLANMPISPASDASATTGSNCSSAEEYQYGYFSTSSTFKFFVCLSAPNTNANGTYNSTTGPRIMYDETGALKYWQ